MALSKKEKLRLLTILLESRHGDLREQNLNRQGKGHFHVSGMGHEALAAISFATEPGDYICGYYRDRALVLGRGVTSRELALDYFAKRKGQSHGRQMPSHYSYAERNIWSVPTPTGAQLLPACGIAWGIKLDAKPNFVIATVGDAATRQGDFYEAVCFAKEKQLPVLFIVEDNAYGISSPTREINPLAIDVLQPNDWRQIDGADVGAVYEAGQEAIAHLRAGKGPVFFWVNMERLSSHTSSDDHKLYRSAEEIENLAEGDPLTKWKDCPDRRRSDHGGGLRKARPGNQRAHPAGIHRGGTRPGSVGRRTGTGSDRQTAAARRRSAARRQIPHRRCREPDLARWPDERLAAHHFWRRRRRSEGRRLPSHPETFDRIPEAGFQFAARGIDHHGRRLRPGLLRQTAGLRIAVHRFHRPGLEPGRDESLQPALALLWHLDLSARDLRALWRLPARRQSLA